MKKTDFIQVKSLDVKELILKANALKKDIRDLTLDKNMKKLKDVKLVSKKKKDLAQVLTVLRQKELLTEIESKVGIKKDESEEVKVKDDKGGK